MDANTMTLAQYLGPEREAPVIVEHKRCWGSLGIHLAYPEIVSDEPDIRFYWLVRTDDPAASTLDPLPRRKTPGMVAYAWRRGDAYSRVRCPCLPTCHNEKIRMEKVGELPVSFPEWKWGHKIDLPVVTV